jgi:hypothetical protein
MTSNAKRREVARVERFTAVGEAAYVMYLELGVGSAASRTGAAITLDNGCPHLLPTTAAPQPSSRLSVTLSLSLALTGRAGSGTGVLLDPLTPRAEAAHQLLPTWPLDPPAPAVRWALP